MALVVNIPFVRQCAETAATVADVYAGVEQRHKERLEHLCRARDNGQPGVNFVDTIGFLSVGAIPEIEQHLADARHGKKRNRKVQKFYTYMHNNTNYDDCVALHERIKAMDLEMGVDIDEGIEQNMPCDVVVLDTDTRTLSRHSQEGCSIESWRIVREDYNRRKALLDARRPTPRSAGGSL